MKKTARPFLLLIPFVVLGSGCNSIPGSGHMTDAVNESYVINNPNPPLSAVVIPREDEPTLAAPTQTQNFNSRLSARPMSAARPTPPAPTIVQNPKNSRSSATPTAAARPTTPAPAIVQNPNTRSSARPISAAGPTSPPPAIVQNTHTRSSVTPTSAAQQRLEDSRANALLNSARQLELAGRYPESIQQFESLLQNGNVSVMALHRLAVLYDKTGQYDRSKPYYQRAVELDPANAELLCDVGYRSSMDGDLQTASKFFELALKHSPNLDRAHNNLAMVLARLNEPDLAMVHFRKAGCTQEEAQHNLSLISDDELAQSPNYTSVATAEQDRPGAFSRLQRLWKR